eukprot:CCRYP_002199-RA/>CCRYP_002199-RA protein AED:0.32 eAED:0.33 QI:0/0/0/1/0/0/3/0/218
MDSLLILCAILARFDSSIILLSTRLPTEAQKEDVNHVMESACNKAASRNYIFKKSGKFVDSLKMATATARKLPLDDDIQSLLQNYQDSEKVAYTTLCDTPINDFTSGTTKKFHYNKFAASLVTISTTKDCESCTILNEDILDIPFPVPIHEIAWKSTKERTFSRSQYLFTLIAWIFLPVFRFFKHCPEDINQQTSCFMWIWIPKEQRISFRFNMQSQS